MEDGYMLRQDPITGLYEKVKIPSDVIEEFDENEEPEKPPVKSVIKKTEVKK